MRFKIDENLPIEVADLLREARHDAITVREQNLTGGSDPDIASICQKEERALITLDTDFADIMTYPPKNYFGLLVLRLRRQDKAHVLQIFSRLIPMFTSEPLKHLLWIVEEQRVRIRG